MTLGRKSAGLSRNDSKAFEGSEALVGRYKGTPDEKSSGATYTPGALADFVAAQIASRARSTVSTLRVLDPALGDGALLMSLATQLAAAGVTDFQLHGFETDATALREAEAKLVRSFPSVPLNLVHGDFLDFVLREARPHDSGGLFAATGPQYDLVIANPPYVRTQILGTEKAQQLADQFGLSGRVDLSYAFVVAMSHVLAPDGVVGIIISNRFMTTKAGAQVRKAFADQLQVRHVWDLGDTRLFNAAVLPAVVIADKRITPVATPRFTSIYASAEQSTRSANDVISALEHGGGVVQIPDGRSFVVREGILDAGDDTGSVWRIATTAGDEWLARVAQLTWKTFGDVGKIRVGVKTCADKVFIRTDWDAIPEGERPELLRPLITHHSARSFRAKEPKLHRQILYPHESVGGVRRAVPLRDYPISFAYLEHHRTQLEARTYVLESGREWFEIWVPQDPDSWALPKLVFRDISEKPTFWIDLDGAVVNGDCYWMVADQPGDGDLLWLAVAVANSSFIESFYDHCFNNKLYAGRRRFITQYVEKFPLPAPELPSSGKIVALAKQIYELCSSPDGVDPILLRRLDDLVWQAFGGSVEKVDG